MWGKLFSSLSIKGKCVVAQSSWLQAMLLMFGLLSFGLVAGAGLARANDEADKKGEAEKKPVAADSRHEEAHAVKADSHGHDATDLTHANGTAELGSPSAMKFDLAIATFVVFALLLALLTKFAWGPISEALDHRENHIANMIATAEQNAQASEKRLRDLETQLAAQADAAREAINQARREGELQRDKILAEAQIGAQREKDRAIEEIRSAKNMALREIDQKSVNTAVDLAKNIIHREVKQADHAQLIQDSLAQFQSRN